MTHFRATGRLASGLVAGLTGVSLMVVAAPAQAAGGAILEKVNVPSASLAGNLEGNKADPKIMIFLPPSYKTNAKKRYPVVYFLHGYFFDVEKYDTYAKFGEAMTANAAKGTEIILVVPDGGSTKFAGSMWSNSVTTGNWEGFVSKDLVTYVDSHYRTLAKPASRGIAGHSMGGYGTLRIAMKYPGIFSSFYTLSACCLSAREINPEQDKKIEAMSMDERLKADFGARAAIASASAWSPNPEKPPFFFDWLTKDGVVQPDVLAQWHANAPNAMIAQYVPALKSYKAIGMEVGDKDGLVKDDTAMHELMTRFGIKHEWQVFDGGHADKVAMRIKDYTIPFFAKNLATK